MTDNTRAEAIEAAVEAIRCLDGPATIGGTPAATAAVDAAVPHLLAPIRALASEYAAYPEGATWGLHFRLVQALDAIEGSR